MPISFDQAFATQSGTPPPAAPTQDDPPPASKPLTFDEVFKAQAAQPKPPEAKPSSFIHDTLRDAAAPVRNWWPEFVKQSNAAIEGVKKDATDIAGAFTRDSAKPGDVTAAWKGIGNILLDLGSAMWSPASAAISTVAVQPLQTQVTNAGEFIKRTMAAPGEAPAGGDAKVHAKDVDNTVGALNEFLDFTIQTAAGLATPGGAERAGRIRQADISEVAGTKTTPIPAAETAKGQAAKLVEDKFDELIRKNSEAANKLAEQVAGSNPEAGKKMKMRIRIKEGQTYEEAVREAMKEGEQHAKLQTEVNRYELAEKDPHWGGVHKIVIGAFEHLFKAGTPDKPARVDAGRFSDILKDAAGPNNANNEYAYRLLDRLSSLLKGKKVDIHFVDTDYLEFDKTHPDGTQTREKADGLYMGSSRRIEIARGAANPVMVAVHEMVHAVTSNFIRDNPNHALTKELEQLYQESKARYEFTPYGSRKKEEQYGFTNLHEFVAEAFSNPDFQAWLSYLSSNVSSAGILDKAKSYYDKFAAIVGKVLGVRQLTDAQLLHGVMSVSNKLMDLQAGNIVSRAAAGVRQSAREVVQAAERQATSSKPPERPRGAALKARAEEIRKMSQDQRDNTEVGDFPGSGNAYRLYAAQKVAPKPADKLIPVSESSSSYEKAQLGYNYHYVANVDGEHFGISKYDDPDARDDNVDEHGNNKEFVYAYHRLDHPDEKMVEPMTANKDELFAHMRQYKPPQGEDVQASVRRGPSSKPPPSSQPPKQDPWNPKFSISAAGALAQGKAKTWWQSALEKLYPEGFGANAKTAAATITARMAEVAQKDAVNWYDSLQRRREWSKMRDKISDFIKGYEHGGIKFKDPWLERARLAYSAWAKVIELRDKAAGIIYQPIDHYFPHIWDDPKGVSEYFDQHYPGWNEPGFTKPRGFDSYAIGLKAGFKLRFTNPEDIMLARQHASDLAHARIGMLQDLERYGLAVEDTKGAKIPKDLATKISSPDGKKYWVHPDANRIIHNAFETESLWNAKGVRGDLYRGAMWLKNTIVPFELALSLFHPLHVATIDNATNMVRATKGLLSGTVGPVEWFKEVASSVVPFKATATFGSEVTKALIGKEGGSRLLRIYRGLEKNPTAAEQRAIQLINEGGLMPELNPELRTRSVEKFWKAWDEKRASVLFRAPFAAMAHLQGAIFQQWIPSLKIASYLKDAETALKADPTLMSDSERRLKTLNQLRKSVDNRYGEMAYNSLFWHKTIKDLAVLNTLSLGWQMGFLREYGGGAIDLAKAVSGKGSGVAKGGLDRPLFVMFYTTQALAYGGLLTWAMTGKQPESLKDYVYPKTGNKNPDGTDERTTTMFYTREFGSLYSHIQTEGALKGMSDLVQSKSSGLFGLMVEFGKGVDSFGKHYTNENDPAYQQLAQRVSHALKEIEPISLRAKETTPAGRARAVLGFGPAPKYVTESATQGRIADIYERFHAAKETSFEKAQRSAEAKEVREAYAAGDSKVFDQKLEAMQEKYKLSAGSIKQMVRGMARGETGDTMMFKSLDWPEQKKILDKMTPEEREKYIPYIHKQFRQEYEDSLP